MFAQIVYQVFKKFRDYFLLTAGGLTRRKRIEMRQTLFDELPVPASADSTSHETRVYQRPKFSAENEHFQLSAFGFGHQR